MKERRIARMHRNVDNSVTLTIKHVRSRQDAIDIVNDFFAIKEREDQKQKEDVDAILNKDIGIV